MSARRAESRDAAHELRCARSAARFAPGARDAVPAGCPEIRYQTTLDALTNDGDIMVTLDVLARQVGVLGIFSDWSGTVSYYASCMGLE